MHSISLNLVLVTGLCVFAACTRYTQRAGTSNDQTVASAASTRTGAASVAPRTRYPYTLFLGSSVYRVEQEPEHSMLALEFRKWSDHRDFERDAVFRVTNRGSRAVFVWNVRRQISTPSSNGVAKAWRTEDGDYPGRGWGNPMILPGGSEEFPMNDDAEGVWRVCLLYSRERPDSKPSNRLFDGTFEAIGPDMLGADTLEWQSSGRSTGE